MGKKSKNSRKIARRGNPDLAQRNPLTSIVKQLEGSLSHDNNELMLYSKVIKKVLAKFPKKGEAVPQCHHHSLGIVHPMDKNEVFWYLLLKQMQNDCNILPNIIKTCDYDMENLVDDANFLLLHETWALAEHARQSPCERHSAGIKGVILTVATELYLKFEYDAVKYFLVDLVSFYARIDELHEPTVNLNDFTLHQLELAFVHAGESSSLPFDFFSVRQNYSLTNIALLLLQSTRCWTLLRPSTRWSSSSTSAFPVTASNNT
jgi:hypothetical protein